MTNERIDSILTRQSHRPRVHDAKVVPQPPPLVKADSDDNIVDIKLSLFLLLLSLLLLSNELLKQGVRGHTNQGGEALVKFENLLIK